jgi:hypothetical protein
MLHDSDFYIEFSSNGKYSAYLRDGTEVVLLSTNQADAEREVKNLVADDECVFDEI